MVHSFRFVLPIQPTRSRALEVAAREKQRERADDDRPPDAQRERPARAERVREPEADGPEHGQLRIDAAQDRDARRLDGVERREHEDQGGREVPAKQQADEAEVVQHRGPEPGDERVDRGALGRPRCGRDEHPDAHEADRQRSHDEQASCDQRREARLPGQRAQGQRGPEEQRERPDDDEQT